MNKNIDFLYEEVMKKMNYSNYNLFFKNFLDLYDNKDVLKDNFLFDNFDLSSLSTQKFNKLNFNFDNSDILNKNFIKNKSKIVLFNGYYCYSENLSDNISIEFNDFTFFSDFEYKNFEYILQNINLSYLFSKIFSEKSLHINILKSKKNYNDKLYILNFYDNNFKNYIFNSNFFINLYKNSKIEIIELNFTLNNLNFINKNYFFNLCDYSLLNYNIFNNFIFKFPYLSSFYVNLFSNCTFNFNNYFSGDVLSKLFFNLFFNGSNSIFNNKKFIELKNDSMFYIDTKIFHYFSKNYSKSIFKVISDDFSIFYSRGIIFLDIDINLIDASLKYDGLLLSNNSEIVFIPELDINSYDIKCNHSATIGCLNEFILYYMMSRGLSKIESIDLLIKSFLVFDFKKMYV